MLDHYRQRPGLILGSIGLALVFQLIRCVSVAVGALALGASVPLAFFITLVPIIVLLGLVPITVAGIGVQETAYVYLLGLAGMTPETALVLALLNRLTMMLTTLPGAWFYMRRGVRA